MSRLYVSELPGSEPDAIPLLVYGHMCEQGAGFIAKHTSISCVAVVDLDDLRTTLGERSFIGITARSRVEACGEAGDAIRAFRALYGETEAAFYGAWDYNVGRAAARALEYGADGIDMPGIEVNESLAYLLAILERVASFIPRPATAAEHELLLRMHAPSSRFWAAQDRVSSPYF